MTGCFAFSKIPRPSIAWIAVVLASFQASAQITVNPPTLIVQQGKSRACTPSRSDNQPAQWSWRLENGPPGGVLDPNTGQYRAPAVVAEGTSREFTLRLTDLAHPGTTLTVKGFVSRSWGAFTMPMVFQAGLDYWLSALRADDLPPTWSWRIKGLEGAQISEQAGRSVLRTPQVAQATKCQLQVQDTAHPGEPLTWEIRVVPAMVNLKVVAREAQPLRSGRWCDLRATRLDQFGDTWIWAVLEPNGGTLQPQANGHARYVAPQVKTPTTFHIQATGNQPTSTAILAVEVRPTIEVVRLPAASSATDGLHRLPAASSATDGLHLVSGNTCTLKAVTARQGAATPGSWSWKVVGAEHLPDLQITPAADPDQVAIQAPDVGWPTEYRLEVRDNHAPGDPALVKLQVMPALPGVQGHDAVFEQIMPKVMGSDWLDPVPVMTLLAGRLGVPKPGRPAPLKHIQCITYVEADPAMGWLSEKWLVGDRTGIKVVSARGEVTPLPGVYGSVTAIAVRPRGNAPGNQDRLSFATESPGPEPHSMVSLLRGGHTAVTLAGSLDRRPQITYVSEGRGSRVHFGRIRALAWGQAGQVLVAETTAQSTQLRQIAKDGQVTSLAGALPTPATAIALDSVTGAAFLANRTEDKILKLLPNGTWEAVIKADPREFNHPHEDGFGENQLVGENYYPYLTPAIREAQGLQPHGDYLFIADTGNHALRVWNLKTEKVEKMLTLVWDPKTTATRLGPLGFTLSAQGNAALKSPAVFHVNQAGDCVVAQGDALVHVDLRAFALETSNPMSDLEPEGDPRVDFEPEAAPSGAAASAGAAAARAQPNKKRPAPLDPTHAQPDRPQPPGPVQAPGPR